MSPDALMRDDGTIRRRFERLVRDNITFVNSWSNPRITPETQRMYSRRKPASEASAEYVRGSKDRLDREAIPYTMSISSDLQRPDGSRSEFVTATDPEILTALDTKTREPKELLFWPGALVSKLWNIFPPFVLLTLSAVLYSLRVHRTETGTVRVNC